MIVVVVAMPLVPDECRYGIVGIRNVGGSKWVGKSHVVMSATPDKAALDKAEDAFRDEGCYHIWRLVVCVGPLDVVAQPIKEISDSRIGDLNGTAVFANDILATIKAEVDRVNYVNDMAEQEAAEAGPSPEEIEAARKQTMYGIMGK